MLRFVFAILIGLCSAVSAYSQSLVIINQPPYSGTPIGSGYDMANGPLFAPTSASLQSLTLPFSYSFDFTIPKGYFPPSNTSIYLYGGQSGSTGFSTQDNDLVTTDSFRGMNVIKPAGSSAACDNASNGNMCWRSLNDGIRHNWCTVWTPTHGYFYLDGILRDETTNVGTFTAGTGTWEIGGGPGLLNWPSGTKFWDVRVYNRALTADECVQQQNLQNANLIANSGTLNSGLVASWPLTGCTVTGANYSCADASGNGNTMDNDKNPPVVVITSPSPGPISGTTVSMQSTCTDTFPCTQVCYYIDGFRVSAVCPTTAPFTYSWDSTKVIDGSHSITAIGTNVGGSTGTSASIAITTNNGISAKTVSVNSSTGSDSNNCVSAPCLTLAHVQSTITFLGGDTFNVIGTFTDAAPFKVCGLLSGCTSQNFYPSSSTFTITTPGGACNPFTLTTTGCGVINVAAFNDGIDLVNASNVTVTNLGVVGPASISLNNYGIQVSGASTGVTITNNYVSNFGYDIWLSGSTGYMVSDNVATSTPAHVNPGPLTCIRGDAGSQGTIEGNLATQCGGQSGNNGNGIMVINYPAPSGTTTMQFNVNHDFGWNDAPNTGGPVGIYTIGAQNVLIQFNESYNGIPNTTGGIDFDCYDIDNGSTNVVEQYNYAHNCPNQAGFNLVTNTNQNPNWGNNTVRYNIAEIVGVCIDIGGDNKTANGYVYNNTCATNVSRGSFVTSYQVCWNSYSTGLLIANNLCIWTGTGPATYVNILTPNESTFLNNDYWSTTCVLPSCTMTWTFNAFGAPAVTYTTLSAYQNASGYDANSLNVNPQISGTPDTGGTCWGGGTSPPAGPQPCPSVYQLTTGSPLIGAGLDLTQAPYSQSVGTRDYYGNAIPNGVGTGYNIGADGAHH